MPACARCGSGLHGGEAEALPRIVAALARDDLDLALAEGLLDWNGCEDCARALGLRPDQVALLAAARAARLRALAARERYRARNARRAERDAQRAARRAAAARLPSSLPPAAAAALARACAKAAKPSA